MIKIKDAVTSVTQRKVTRVTPVTVVTSGAKAVRQARIWADAMAEGTHCPTCGYRLPAKSKAAAKQAAYRARRKGNA